MKKKYLIIIFLILGVSFYFYQKKSSVIISYKELNELKKNTKSADNTEINTPTSIKVSNDNAATENKPEKKVYETRDEKFDAFEKMEKAWLLRAKSLMTDKQFVLYEDMRNRNDKEKADAYQAYHDYLRAKYGNNFKYNISEDQSIREKKINESYLKELKNLIGEDKFRTYLAIRDQYNEELRRSSNGKSVLIIEF